jgi:tetratricopeptide (TPR) repeat protein
MRHGRLLLFFVILLTAARARAAGAKPDADAANKAAAKAHFQQGTAAYALADYDNAIREYEAAYKLFPLPDILFNIAQSYRFKGEKKIAVDYYQRYLRAQSIGGAADEARAHIAELARLIELEAREAERRAEEKRAADEAAQRAAAQTKPRIENDHVPPPNLGPARRGRVEKIAGVALIAVGVAALAAGGAFVGLAKAANDDFLHPRDGVFNASAEDKRSLYSTLDITFFAVGGAAAISGITLLLVGHHHAHNWSLAPVVSPERAALSLTGRF